MPACVRPCLEELPVMHTPLEHCISAVLKDAAACARHFAELGYAQLQGEWEQFLVKLGMRSFKERENTRVGDRSWHTAYCIQR
eukprot:1161303-Pelagomonas_calceolata.AAC.5